MATEIGLIAGFVAARPKKIGIAAATAYPAIQLQYVGPGATGTYEVDAGGTNFKLNETSNPGGAVTEITLDLTAAAYDTMAELVAALNAQVNNLGEMNWLAKQVGFLPTTSTAANLTVIAATNAKVAGGVTIMYDAGSGGTVFDGSFSITNQKFTQLPGTNDPVVRNRFGLTDAGMINAINYMELTVTATTPTVEFWAVNDKTGVATQIHPAITVTTATLKTIGLYPDSVFISAPPDCRLCCMIMAAGAQSSLTLFAHGSTRSIDGSYPSHGANFTGCL